ncbi:MAG TPA: ATP-binding protein [Opitutaceae bacterium]
MKLSLERKIVAGFGAALIVMAAVGVTAWWLTNRLDDTFGQVDHTHRVLNRLEQSVNEMLALQGDIRAYLLTGDEAYLARASRGSLIIRESIDSLQGLLADNPEQLKGLAALAAELDRGSLFVRRITQARRDKDEAALASLGGSAAFDRLILRLRTQISAMENEERRLLEARSLAVREALTVVMAAVVGTASVAGVLLVAAIVVVRRDFALQKRTDRALKETSARYEDLYNQAPCGYHSLDRQGLFTEVNDTELAWLGYRREEVVGQLTFARLCTPASRQKFESEFPRFLETGDVRNVEFDLIRKDGTVLPVLLNATAIRDAEGRVIASRSTLYDVTARREADRAIQTLNQNLQRQNAQLEAVNRELEAFSYSVSHDLRAPLRHVDGFAGLLTRQYASQLDAKGHRYLETISAGAKQMGRLIDDLLSFSQMGRAPLRLSQVDHDALVAEVIRSGNYATENGSIEWQIGSLPPVEADPAMLRQVWTNLIGNAVKYSRKGERPRIEIGGTEALASGEHVFFVRDNGVGFDMKYVDKLFGVFQRLHGPTEFEGTGIGLANVRRIVSRHAGRTWAEGRPGVGATFYFSLPSAITPPAPGDSPTTPPATA